MISDNIPKRPSSIFISHGGGPLPLLGDPDLAQRLQEALQQNQIETLLDMERGFDHGLFVPLLLMYPKADIPCVQLSLPSSLDPAEHIRIGPDVHKSVASGR